MVRGFSPKFLTLKRPLGRTLRAIACVSLLALLQACASTSSARPAAHSASGARHKSASKGRSKASGETKRVSPKRKAQPSSPPGAKVPEGVATTTEEANLLSTYEGRPARRVYRGKATYYGNSLAGHKTASGEVYNPQHFTAAHRQLPFGTVLRVVRTDTNRYVYVRITDRGPFAGGGRIIDLSYIAAQRLGMIRVGVAPVRLEVVSE